MAVTSRVKTWNSGDTLTAADLNAEFNNLLSGGINNIQDANIASGAAISTSKINTTFPSGVIVGNTDTQTLSNKTLTKPTVNGSVGAISTYSPSGGGTATLDLSNANIHSITVPSGNITITLTNVSVGQAFVVRFVNDSSVRTITWFSTIKWPGGNAPVLSGSNKVDTFGFICTGSNTYDGYIVGQGLS